MARIEWVRQQLENWSKWCEQRDSNGLGYPSQCAFARLGGKGSRAESVVPIINEDAMVTDEAVKALRSSHPHLHQTIVMIYPMRIDRYLVARRLCRAESTICRQLEDADHVLARWYGDRKQMIERRRQSVPA